MSRIMDHFIKRLMAGVFIWLPLVLCWWILKFVFVSADGILEPATTKFIGQAIPGAGIALLVILLYGTGLAFATKWGKKIIECFQRGLLAIPLLKSLYSVLKKLTESFTGSSGFSKVVAIRYPSNELTTLAFAIRPVTYRGKKHLLVYIPTPPSPQSGNLCIVPEEAVEELQISANEMLMLIFSIGFSGPSDFTPIDKTTPETEQAE